MSGLTLPNERLQVLLHVLRYNDAVVVNVVVALQLCVKNPRNALNVLLVDLVNCLGRERRAGHLTGTGGRALPAGAEPAAW